MENKEGNAIVLEIKERVCILLGGPLYYEAT